MQVHNRRQIVDKGHNSDDSSLPCATTATPPLHPTAVLIALRPVPPFGAFFFRRRADENENRQAVGHRRFQRIATHEHRLRLQTHRLAFHHPELRTLESENDSPRQQAMKSRDRYNPNSQDCGSGMGGAENALKARYGQKGGSATATGRAAMAKGSGKLHGSYPRSPQKLRG